MTENTTANTKPRVLVTGAAGRIGRCFARAARDRFRLRLADRDAAGLEPLRDCTDEQPLVFDVTDPEACGRACRGCDAVIHLAGSVNLSDDAWPELHHHNIDGVYQVFDACAREGVGRLVYASSAQTVEAHPKDVQLNTRDQVRPDNLYGVCKAFGEALAAFYAHRSPERGGGPTAVCVRIANFREEITRETRLSRRDMTAYLSPRDMSEILSRAVEAEGVRFAIVNAVSDNRYKRLRMDETCELLGVELQDDAFATLEYPEPAPKSDPAF